MFLILIIFILFSGIGMFYMVASRIEEVRAMSRGQFISALRESKPVFSDFNHYFVSPIVHFTQTIILPKIFKEFEKMISMLRINILKVEKLLLDLSRYIKGKREIKTNGKRNPYWKDMNDFKNGLPEQKK